MAKDEKKVKRERMVFTTGKRKTAVARARVKAGDGRIVVNDVPLELWGTEYLRLKVRESLLLAGDLSKRVDVKINAKGGGMASQAEAIAQAMAKGLVEFFKDEELKKRYLDHDRNLLVYDERVTEPHKPSRSKKGARRHKQRSKR